MDDEDLNHLITNSLFRAIMFQTIGLQSDMLQCFQHLVTEVTIISPQFICPIFIVCWVIWDACNEVIRQGIHVNIEDIFLIIRSYLNDCRGNKSLDQQYQVISGGRWYPADGWLKFNSDAGYKYDFSTFGSMLCSSTGFVRVVSGKQTGSDVIVVEAWLLLSGFLLATFVSATQLETESDYRISSSFAIGLWVVAM